MRAPVDSTLKHERPNRLIQLLPNGERRRLEASMERIPIQPHDMLHRAASGCATSTSRCGA